MGSIEEETHPPPVDLLATARPVGLDQAVQQQWIHPHLVCRVLATLCLRQIVHGQLNGQGTVQLYHSAEVIVVVGSGHLRAEVLLGGWHLVYGVNAMLLRPLTDHLQALRLRDMREDARTGLDNARLLPRNLLEGVAQQIRVLQGQRCDAHRAHVAHDIGAVRLAANAHLQHGHVHLLRHEDVEAQYGDELEVGGHVVVVLPQLPQAIVHFPEVLRELGLVQRLAIDADALVGGQDVGRGIETCFKALVAQQGLSQSAGGALRKGINGDLRLNKILFKFLGS